MEDNTKSKMMGACLSIGFRLGFVIGKLGECNGDREETRERIEDAEYEIERLNKLLAETGCEGDDYIMGFIERRCKTLDDYRDDADEADE